MTDKNEQEQLKISITKEIQDSIAVTTQLAQTCSSQIVEAAALIISCLRSNAKLIAFGNGGSAAEAQHLVAELVGRYRSDRQPLAAIALTSESASITAISNDYGFDHVFSRQLQAVARPGDVVLAISTSGNSPNVIAALESAKTMGLHTVGITGQTGGKLAALVDLCVRAPSDCTPRIQEAHMLMIHLLCGLVENAFLSATHRLSPSHSVAGEVR
ncbi:MAG: D-sedoheptulose 7-phosphate isomerase [Acidobacteriota bacterium]|nr:D-sedoheptulose 7-phosphate isomerase [Acidobacteriota bacterium]